MQHFARPVAIADALDADRYEIHLYSPSRYFKYLANKPYSTGELQTMPGERFLRNLSRGAPLFPANVLRDYVKEERQLIRKLRPDLVIGDLRFSLPVSARLEGVPSAILMNAYWSPHAPRRSIIPELPITRLIPPGWLSGVFRLAEPLVMAAHVRGINTIRKEHGFSPLPPDPRFMYVDGDYVLYPDVPDFVPVQDRPAHHRYIGPCQWQVPKERPAWWQEMLVDPRPKVFVSLGSSGPVRILPRLLRVLERLPVAIVMATSGRSAPPDRRGVFVAPFLPFSETAAASKLVISHGGSSGFYPAIAAGTPVLGIPSNADQQISAAVLAGSGAGLSLRVEEASERRLTETIERILSGRSFSDAAIRWKTVFAITDSRALFQEFLTSAGL